MTSAELIAAHPTPPASATPTATADETMQCLTFSLRGEMYAISIAGVKEIIEYGHLTAIPMAPPCLRGVINLRGVVVPVVDLAVRFGLEPTTQTRRTCIVIVEVLNGTERQDVGIVVDAVSEVIDIRRDQIEPAPHFGTQVASEFIAGMAEVNGSFVVLLELGVVLSLDELARLAVLTSSPLPAAA